jgi:ABC-type transporter Mla subunit MlaD
MDSSQNAFRVGIFVIGGLIALIAVIMFLASAGFNQGQPFETYFRESVQGLDVGTAVRFHGVTVGQVTDVGLVFAEYPPANPDSANLNKAYRQVIVRYRINVNKIGARWDFNRSIERGLRAQLRSQGITGLSYIELTFVNPAENPVEPVPWTPRSPVIPSIPSTLTQLTDAVQEAITSLGQANLPKMLDQLGDLIETLNEQVSRGDVRQAVGNANELLETLNTTVKQSDLPATSAAIRNLAGGPKTLQMIAQLNQTTAQLAKISAQLPALVAASQNTVQQTSEIAADMQAQLGPIMQDLRSTTANLRVLSDSLSRNPAQVINGAQPPPPPSQQGASP